ncbi:hypothetical protein ACE6HX_03090 [Bacillus pumilus]|uniref:hypothetical protein n=1 Tax=Bacillus TaxID=1386 RepID=UPI00049F04B7|nr:MULTISPECIES: hypothetical protein [Bacillus]MCY7619016.1 hypothetical protein [Bacillus pumilus]PRS73450.1 hypothetical protein C6Y03_13760 [Bacillus sp. LNXM65]QKN79511.1 hypothetical protein GZ55_17865 [Bacillus pumilus]QLI44498.1 hypothetical protein DJ67_008780 [Bacillus pumilus]QNP16982.1 hypothetical protein H9S87_02945 [Bacillus pumilus]
MGIFLITFVFVMIAVTLVIYLFKKGIIRSKVLVIVGSVLGGTVLVVWIAMFFNFYSIALTDESIGHFKIGQTFKGDHNFVENSQFSHPKQTVYMEKENQDFVVSVDQHDRVITIYNHSTQKNLQTSKGVKIGEDYSSVIQTYGDQFKKLWFVEGYSKGIQYQDQSNGIILEFFFNDNTLALIELRSKRK